MKVSLGFLSKLKIGRRGRVLLHPTRLINPVREWAIGLGVSAILFLTLATYMGFDFYTQYHNVDTPPTEDESILRYREKDVQWALEVYREKETKFNLLREDRSAAMVPVLPPNEPSTGSTTENAIPLAEEPSDE